MKSIITTTVSYFSNTYYTFILEPFPDKFIHDLLFKLDTRAGFIAHTNIRDMPEDWLEHPVVQKFYLKGRHSLYLFDSNGNYTENNTVLQSRLGSFTRPTYEMILFFNLTKHSSHYGNPHDYCKGWLTGYKYDRKSKQATPIFS